MSLNCLARWDDRTAFREQPQLCDTAELQNSIAGFVVETIANIHNALMGTEYGICIKLPCVLVLDGVLLLTAPIIALAEAILRLVLAIITSPLPCFACCLSNDTLHAPSFLALSALYSLYQIPNTFTTAYKMLTSDVNVKPLKWN